MAQSASNVSLHKVLRMDMVILWTWKTAGHLLVTTATARAMYSSMERIANAAMLNKLNEKKDLYGSAFLQLWVITFFVYMFMCSKCQKKLDECQYVACQSGFFAAFQVDSFCQAPFTCSARNMENPGGLEMSETSRPSLANFMANMTISAEGATTQRIHNSQGKAWKF